ncbi:MAG TPA: energy transducer TonB [Stellaceae bacterium]|jgi:protein TonB
MIGIGVVVALHVVIIYALVTVLARRNVERPHAPIETKIISAPQPETPPPPPPPLPQLAVPPPLYVPPPEVSVAKPPPPQSTAPTVVTNVAPATPAPTAPVRTTPHVDLAHSSQPDYPPEARRLSEQGSLVLQVLVEPDGRVSDAKLVQSSGFPLLDQAALAGVKTNYRFTPGTVDGKPQPMWFTFRFVWRLR